MNETDRETQLVDVFTTLADTLVADYDVLGLLQSLVDNSVELFEITAAGILLADQSGQLEVVVSTSEASHLIEVMQIDAEAGPCMDCFSTGQVVSVPEIDKGPKKWFRFQESAADHGFRSVFAVPLRLRSDVIGTLNLLSDRRGALNERDQRAAQALADVATIGVLNERTLRESNAVREQLQSALDSRVIIEQAKGVLSEVRGVSPDEAFALLRAFSRNNNTPLSRVAREIVARRLRL